MAGRTNVRFARQITKLLWRVIYRGQENWQHCESIIFVDVITGMKTPFIALHVHIVQKGHSGR